MAPYANNARTHSEAQVQSISKSIQEFGFVNPVLVDADGTLIAGHGRVMAAKLLGLDKVPTVVISHLSERQRKALILADNKLAMSAGWDMELLANELSELAGMDFDLELTGFDEQELDSILKSDMALLPEFVTHGPGQTAAPAVEVRPLEDVKEGLTEDDQAPEEPVQPVTQRGDVWQLGEHKVMCGDSTDNDDVVVLMAGSKAQMVFTDPPYNVKISGLGANEINNPNSIGKIHGEFVMASGEMSEDEFTEFLRKVFTNLKNHSEDGAIHYVCMDWRHIKEVLKASETYATVGGGNCRLSSSL